MTQNTRRFLRLPDVIRLCGYGRTTIYEKIKAGEFPSSYPLGARAVGWLSDEIEAWIELRVRAARKAA